MFFYEYWKRLLVRNKNKKKENMEHISNRDEPSALEMTNVIKNVTSFLNAHKDLCYKFELIPTFFFT